MSEAPFTLRIARPDDANRVQDVLAASYSTLYRGWYRDEILAAALPLMTRARPELLASGRYFLCQWQGRAIACGGWSFANPRGGADAGRGHIRHFGTHPDFTGRGAASAMVERCLGEARAGGCMEMECLASLTAEAFYAGRGFKTVAPTSISVGGAAFACMLMRREL
ncbi:MAG TPA: GNAT family N-acetyltransferase [Parvularcula sp.]|nr:GNAT family N-acetyltransferase [Parvularcula sp.]HBS32212.1 GNAT family N-acetyltransferase [Parvularcula sp.]HBS35101.1 GNAT family N-acetyltransferase [Parvularcula sp.]